MAVEGIFFLVFSFSLECNMSSFFFKNCAAVFFFFFFFHSSIIQDSMDILLSRVVFHGV